MTTVVHRWAAPGLGSVNTYWIETDEAVIVIDGQRELSKARRVLADIVKTGKPIAAVFLTHPHPDHFGGLGVFAPTGSGVPIYGSRQTRDSIAEDRFGLVKASHEVVEDDFPPNGCAARRHRRRWRHTDDRRRRPGRPRTRGGRSGMHDDAVPPGRAGLPLRRRDPDRMTAFLLEGRIDAWLAQLDRLAATWGDVDQLYPGHGEPGSPHELVARQVAYLRTFRTIVADETRGRPTTEAANERVVHAMELRFPGYQPVAAIPDLLKQNIAPTAKAIEAGSDGKRSRS